MTVIIASRQARPWGTGEGDGESCRPFRHQARRGGGGGPQLRAGVLDEEIIELMAKYRPPAIYERRRHVEEDRGGLMAPGTIFELSRCVASYSDRIFKTAKALGLTIPPSLLARADQVIE